MPPGLLALSAVLRLVLADATLYDVSLTATARERTRASVVGVVGELQAEPKAALWWIDREAELGASYEPQLLLQERVSGLQALHRATARGAWRADARWTLFTTLEGAYGTNDLLVNALGPSQPDTPVAAGSAAPSTGGAPAAPAGTPATAPPAPLQSIPRLTTVQYVLGGASLGLAGSLTARTRLVGQLEARISGGGDAAAREALPLERAVRASTDLEWTAGPADVLVTSFSAGYGSFAPRPSDPSSGVTGASAGIAEGWRHTLRGGAQLRASLGPTVTARRQAGITTWAFAPSAEVGVADRVLRIFDGDVALRAVAAVDRVTTAIYQRSELTGRLAWHPGPRWTLGVTGAGSVVSSGDQKGDKTAAGEVRAGWSPAAAWELSVGLSAVAQISGAPQVADVTEAMAFVAVSARRRDRL